MQPGIEPRSPGPLVNTLATRPMSWFCIEMDLALNNLQRLIWHKTQLTNYMEEMFFSEICGWKFGMYII